MLYYFTNSFDILRSAFDPLKLFYSTCDRCECTDSSVLSTFTVGNCISCVNELAELFDYGVVFMSLFERFGFSDDIDYIKN